MLTLWCYLNSQVIFVSRKCFILQWNPYTKIWLQGNMDLGPVSFYCPNKRIYEVWLWRSQSDFIEIIPVYLQLVERGSPSKYYPWAVMRLVQQCCHHWKHFWNSCCGVPLAKFKVNNTHDVEEGDECCHHLWFWHTSCCWTTQKHMIFS